MNGIFVGLIFGAYLPLMGVLVWRWPKVGLLFGVIPAVMLLLLSSSGNLSDLNSGDEYLGLVIGFVPVTLLILVLSRLGKFLDRPAKP